MARENKREGRGVSRADEELKIVPAPKIIPFDLPPPDMPKAPASSTLPLSAALAPATPVATSFEAAQNELEQLVAQLESGDMPLEQLMSGYQRGAALLAFCRERLQAIENQIKVLDAGGLKAWTPE
jgi:exodeoxyribonuclease VII small subunit